MEYELCGDGRIHKLFDTLDAAIEFAHGAGCESFEVYTGDGDDQQQVYCERPIPVWA